MAPLLAHAMQHSGTILAAVVRPTEDVSEAGTKVVHEDSWGLVTFAAMFFIPFVALFLAVGWWAHSRMKDQEVVDSVKGVLKKHKSESSLKGSASLTESAVSAPHDPESQTLFLQQKHEELHEHGLKNLLFTKMNIMLLFVPLGFCAHFLHWGATTTFMLNMIAMLPLAGLMGVATEELACHTGQTIGGLLNATFGNAVELIFVVQSLRSGLITVTKGTLLGSILANELLVLGMALLFGGLFDKDGFAFNKQQSFSFVSAMIQAQLLIFSSFMIVMPSMFEKSYHIEPVHVLHLSRMGSVFALVGYCIFMVFQLYTHSDMLRAAESGDDLDEEEEVASVSVPVAVGLLTASTIFVAICSEFLVHGIDGFAHEMGFSQTFIGVVLLPIIGNACEHSTAVVVALKDKVTLAIGIAIGSTIQVSLFVVPFAVIVGWMLDQPMDLDFHRLNSWALLLSSLLVMSVLVVGKSTWMNGFVLISAYCILAFLYFLSPDDALASQY
jgi:Ca2+:H+ antiporter